MKPLLTSFPIDETKKVALIFNAEHTSQSQLFLMNQDIEIGNAVNARRWYVSGSAKLQQLVKSKLHEYNVSVYTTSERAILNIIDEANKMTILELRGDKPLPNPLSGPRNTFGTRN
jgi:hypothetical protein